MPHLATCVLCVCPGEPETTKYEMVKLISETVLTGSVLLSHILEFNLTGIFYFESSKDVENQLRCCIIYSENSLSSLY